MLKISTNARTTWVGELVISEPKFNADGSTYNSKYISFQIASNRDYKSFVKDQNGNFVIGTDGNKIQEKKSDFIYCRAYGSTAQVISDYCSAKDPVTGKIISRHLSLCGSLETYKSKKEVVLQYPIEGIMYNIPFMQETEGVMFVVKEIEFLDSNAKTKAAQNGFTLANNQNQQVATTLGSYTTNTSQQYATLNTSQQSNTSQQYANTLTPTNNAQVSYGVNRNANLNQTRSADELKFISTSSVQGQNNSAAKPNLSSISIPQSPEYTNNVLDENTPPF